jgi:nitric oxide dioxygenase
LSKRRYESVDASDHRSKEGLMDLSDVPLPEDSQVFTCGPLPFMRHLCSMQSGQSRDADCFRQAGS